jgi:hypothetical protein
VDEVFPFRGGRSFFSFGVTVVVSDSLSGATVVVSDSLVESSSSSSGRVFLSAAFSESDFKDAISFVILAAKPEIVVTPSSPVTLTKP